MNRAPAAAVAIERLARLHAPEAVALLETLRVSLFGIQSTRLYEALVHDAVTRRIDGRVAVASGHVCGVVLAAPRGYWMSALLTHWRLAVECLRARLFAHEQPQATETSPPVARPPAIAFDRRSPRRTWIDPGDAWRIIIVGTAPAARGRGVAADLYRALMRDRSLVARVAPANHASIRLHRSAGWRLYPDGDVVLAVHELELPQGST
ncbi:MAG TPA: GNAT family N-acetyltransferase [Vicinamibacterales bacterium]|nr:GNAT family N-acetyltransferase [Vicinamibacterales bacterium]